MLLPPAARAQQPPAPTPARPAGVTVILKDGKQFEGTAFRVAPDGGTLLVTQPVPTGGTGEIGYPFTLLDTVKFPEPGQLDAAREALAQGKDNDALTGIEPIVAYYSPLRYVPGNKSTRATEHRVQMAQRQKTMSAPAQAKRVTTTATNARVALPQMPALPALASVVTPARMGGMGGAGFGTMAAGAPGGGGPGGGGPQLFGFHKATGGGSFVGTFFDYKQNRGGQPSRLAAFDRPNDPKAEVDANNQTVKEVGALAAAGFAEGALANYYRGPDPLYATQVYIPSLSANEGPKAFGLADKVRPRRWVVVYRASVTPAESGRYRFVGRADDFLIVRFNHRIVLDGSIQFPTGRKPGKTYHMDGLRGTLPDAVIGDPVDVSASEKYDLEVLIGELPGGYFLAYLQLEKEGAEYAKDTHGSPVLPLFRLAPGEVPPKGDSVPAIAKDTT